MTRRMVRLLLYLIVVFISLSNGCFKNFEEVVKNDSYTWSYRDILIVMASSISHNLIDNRTNIKVIATPYYPQVIMAIQRMAQHRAHWTEAEFRHNTDILLYEALGMYYEWNTRRFVDGKGNYLKDMCQFDSLLFLVTIDNKAGGSYIPEISNIENRIYLVNDKNKFIRPRYVWGRRHNTLIDKETLFAMFYFREGEHHFLRDVKELMLVIKGFECDIWLDFSLAKMR